MKMKQLIVAVLCVLSFLGSAQNEDVKINIGGPLKYDRGAYSEIFNVNNVNYLIRKIDKSKIELTRFDADLTPNKPTVIELTHEGKSVKLSKVFVSGESIVVISHQYVKKSNKEEIYKHVLDLNKIGVLKHERIAEISLSNKHEDEYYLKLFFASSPSNSKFLIFYTNTNIKVNPSRQSETGVLVFDNEFKLEWKRKNTMPLIREYEQLLVDDEGGAYLLKKKHPFVKNGNVNYDVIKYSKEEVLILDVGDLDVEKGKIGYLMMKDNGGELILGGFTKAHLNDLRIEGGVFFTLNKTNLELIKSHSFQFEDKYIKHTLLQSLTPNPTFEEEGQEYGYYLKDIFITDNYISLVAEQVTSETFKNGTIKSRWESGITTTSTVLYNMDVIITQVSKDFTTHRVRKITKVQASINNSIVTTLQGSTIHVLYNDRPGNPSVINSDKIPMTYNIGKCLVKRVSLKEDGEFYENEFVTNEKRTYLVPSINDGQIRDGKLVFYTNKSKEGKLVEYSFNK